MVVEFGGIGENLGCFGASKKKKEGQSGNQNRESVSVNRSTTRTEPVTGMELLWQPEVKFQSFVYCKSTCVKISDLKKMLLRLCKFI